MSMISSYIKQERDYVSRFGPKTMFLLQCGSFYEVYSCKEAGEFTNDRIEEFSRICDMRIANKRSKCNDLPVFMSGFPELHLEKYVNKLNGAGWTVAVHCQDKTCPTIRKEMGIFSPGTNFESIGVEPNRTMTVRIEVYAKTKLNNSPKVSCGIACVDIGSGDVFTFQCVEEYFHNPTTFDELERFYCSYKPRELIIIHNCEDKQIDDIIAFSDIESMLVHKIRIGDVGNEWYNSVINSQKQTYQEEQLVKYYDIPDYNIFHETHSLQVREYATQSLVFLLNFLDYHNNDLVKQLKLPIFTNIENRVRLANHSLRQLNIIDTGHTSPYSSLMSLVNKCKTPMGKRYLSNKLLNPTTDTDYLTTEYNIVDYLSNIYKSGPEWNDLFMSLTAITDFERLFRKLILQKVVPSDMSILYDNLNTILSTKKNIDSDENVSVYLDEPNIGTHLKTLKRKIRNSLNVKAAGEISCKDIDVNIFKEGVFPILDEAEDDYNRANVQLCAIQEHLAAILHKEKNPIKIHQTEKSGLFLMVTQKRWKSLKSVNVRTESGSKYTKAEYDKASMVEYRFKDEVHHLDLKLSLSPLTESRAGGNNVRIDNVVITKLYNTIMRTKSNFKDILKSTFSGFVNTFLENKPEFDKIISYVTKLDFLLTRTHVAIQNNYCKPTIDNTTEQSFIDAKNIRHPLIEHINNSELYVPNDISIGCADSHTGIMLFGTNAVGKSSLIRSVGMSLILAQAGFFVPCSDFTYKPYKAIFTRILGNDDIFKGLSTFAVEMSELSSILKSSDNSTLILGDELCSGTETTSALCIVSASIEMLHNMNSSFIFATHFHELTERRELMALERLSLQHMIVRYDKTSHTLIYDRKLKDGSGDKLYGLEVCKALSMPVGFISLANKYRCKYSSKHESVLDSKQSKYNTHKLKNKCEICENKATEIHHMQPQCDADDSGFIDHFSKNHKANLMSICGDCHTGFTKDNIKHIRVKTTDGMRLEII